ncbi:ribonuclease E/G [Nocardioides coralli]|uniref:ribonuclease E/G n=1 Tax=Nocardioides coralli TaxID=2872154 RepID=UPI001CA3EA32|nr:ribonuclease E/G [Nocardioides coralli]QZY28261.1 Rne/Rng family ribonuclease [Nocardioides coralli]
MTEDTTPESTPEAAEAAAQPAPEDAGASASSGKDAKPAKKAAAKKATTAKKSTTAKKPTAKKTAAKKSAAKKAAEPTAADATADAAESDGSATDTETPAAPKRATRKKAEPAPAESPSESTEPDEGPAPTMLLFQAPDTTQAPAKPRRAKPAAEAEPVQDGAPAAGDDETGEDQGPDDAEGSESGDGASRRRRRRGGRRRRKSGGEDGAGESDQDADAADTSGDPGSTDEQAGEPGSSSSRRRRRRRRAGESGGDADDDPQNTVTKVRQGRSAEDQITAVTGSTRLEAKKQRRREGREAGRRRAPIVSEAEFLARRESVDRVMAIRQREDLTQIAVLEDKVLVEHYVARESQTSLIGNVYLGRVQNVLPSMEAAFIDIGKGRNAVLYAGEVNWSALGHKDGQPRKIESVLSSGQSVLVQVTKDPVGHKGARLTSQVSLAGRFLVYVPDGTNSGISRKLPDTERNRLKSLLKEIVPDGAGVIVRTAAEGASEDELTRDVERLTARWADIEKKAKGNAPQLLYGEPDLMLKVVRDLFTEDFSKLVVQGDDAWDTVHGYVTHVAPDLEDRLEKHDGDNADLFATYRIEEQIHKGLDRKVWLPSGGSLIIDRTEAMTVVDVNTGKFTGSGGNLEETVTKNNLEAAEEIVRQLRLRDIGGIIVIDFIDMVLESNRDLVLRRLVECLGRDRTRHQVAEVTSLGLVQMTRKRIGTGLLEAFSETCEHCGGRGLITTEAPVEPKKGDDDSRRGNRRSRRGRGGAGSGNGNGGSGGNGQSASPSPKDVAAMARPAPKQAEDAEDAGNAETAETETEGSTAEPDAPVPAAAADQAQPAAEQAADATPDRSGGASEPSAQEKPDQAPDRPESDEPSPASEPARGADTPTEPGPERPAEPQAPKVVTRTRRRSASRPAGPPAGASAAPPTAVGSIGSPPVDGAVEPGTADAEPATPPVVEHVPVKKRGSRKR